jgi:agmatinase
MTLTTAPRTGHATFLHSDLATDLGNLKADIAFLCIHYRDAYSLAAIANGQARYFEKPAT